MKLRGPGPEVHTSATKLDLPPVPSLELPPGEPGFHDPFELQVAGKPLLGSDLRVKGYIIWIYDCQKAIARPRETPAQVRRRTDEDPTLCERPKLYLGSAKDTPLDRGLWVVDVPRPPNKLEKERLPRAELAAWPAATRRAGARGRAAGDRGGPRWPRGRGPLVRGRDGV